ncbi:MAG: ATP-binding protein, partial [Boseongicola sp. SB0673_bin_14]|nr:ATP-binding protein [Boseongicola sp. SB0673_bin_14]
MGRQDKGESAAKKPERPDVQGGGAATSAGILFQQQVGAVFGSRLLAERPLDHRLDLGQAKPERISFETMAPVDDILVETSDGGFIAIQAKTNVSLSKDLGSPFGKTVSQFVRHWLVCRDGDGKLNWNRPLNPRVDRLVFAVGPKTSANVRVTLPAALRQYFQPGGGQLNAGQQRAFDRFESCVQAAWAKATTDAYSAEVVQELAALIRVLSFDFDGSSREAAIETIKDVAQEPGDASGIFSGLETVSAELMAGRGAVDLQTARQKLLGRGFRLLAPPDFRADIARLKDHGAMIAETLKRHEEIKAADGKSISIVRECQDAVRDAALGGSLLIIGEPGAGKSGVLSALARDLKERGSDVLELAADRYSVETMEGLKSELRLEHGLIDTLEAWDGPAPAWLIVDGLDASRGGPGGGVFRNLIERVMSLGGRWKAVASIRTFDLRMGQKFQALFKGTPSNEELTEEEFSQVRHVKVPPWTQAEFDQLLDKAPTLATIMGDATENPQLQDVARVPFNTRLLNELIGDGLVIADLSQVGSQAELLQLYWKHRIETHGAPARQCIRRIAKSMVKTRILRAPFEKAAKSDAAVLDALEGAGVLTSDSKRRKVQFRHHLLFDYATARVLLDPERLIAGKEKMIGKSDARGLMLAPALRFVLQEIWMREPGRAAFWTAAAHVLADKDCDPVIRSATARICAEFPCQHDDIAVLAKRIVAGDENAARAFTHMCGALGIRLEDDSEVPLAPWTGLVRDIAPNVAAVHGALRFLLFRLVDRVDDQNLRRDLGISARALLDHALSLVDPGNLVSSAIDLVGETYASAGPKSRALLEKVFVPDRQAVHAALEVPALCRKIGRIAETDPEFGARIYRETYGFQVNDMRETSVSDSQILPLISNARQDYGMARYALKEFFGEFLELHPYHAVDAIVQAVECYVEREHARNADTVEIEIKIGKRSVRLREDLSYIWASDPESDYDDDDADALIKRLLEHLRSADEANAIRIAERLVETSSLAVFWSRLFLAAGERNDKLLAFCLPIAMQQAFLTSQETAKDAVDVVAKGYERMQRPEKEAFEAAVSQFDFSQYARPDDERIRFERRLFGAIGEASLATSHARAVVKACGTSRDARNDRPYSTELTGIPLDTDLWFLGNAGKSPANRNLKTAID